MIAPFLTALLVAAAPSPFPAGTATAICGSKAIPYQQQALASTADAVWVACRSAGTVVRVAPGSGRPARTARLAGFRPWAISAGAGALWAIDRERPELWKLDARTGRRIARIPLGGMPASLWFGAGSVWIGFETAGFARVDPRSRRATTSYDGDGVSAFASNGKSVFVVSHRDNAIARVDLASGRTTRIASHLSDTATGSTEAAVYAAGSLWVTGRGLDLLRVDPASGKITATVEVGPAGFGVAVADGRLLVASYTAGGAKRGDPVVGSFGVVDPATNTVAASVGAKSTSYLSGFVVRGSTVFAADTVLGRLVRLPLPS